MDRRAWWATVHGMAKSRTWLSNWTELNLFISYTNTEKKSDSVSHSVLSDSLWPHILQPARLLGPWNSPGKNTGVGCHSLLQGIFPELGIQPRSLALQADSLPSEPPGKSSPALVVVKAFPVSIEERFCCCFSECLFFFPQNVTVLTSSKRLCKRGNYIPRWKEVAEKQSYI